MIRRYIFVKYMIKFTFQNRECNTTSMNKIRVKELRQVVEMAFKQMSVMSSKDANVKMFKEWNDNVHRALEPILWEICCNTYTMLKEQHPSQGHSDGMRGFK